MILGKKMVLKKVKEDRYQGLCWIRKENKKEK